MPEILYSDIEVTAKVVMDPRTMDKACNQIYRLLELHGSSKEFSALERLHDEMRQVLGRLAEMQLI